jgi:hypothetical protein
MQPNTGYVALDANNVYWATLGGTNLDQGTVRGTAKLGGTITDLAQFAPGSFVFSTAANANGVFFASTLQGSGSYSVQLVTPSAPGTVITLASGESVGSRLVFDSSSVYWTSYGSMLIRKSSQTSGPASTARPWYEHNTDMLGVDATTIYWIDQPASGNTTRVLSAPANGSGVARTLSQALGPAVMDATDIYGITAFFTGGRPPWLVRLPKDGSKPARGIMTVSSAYTTQPVSIAVDNESVYLGTRGQSGFNNGTIQKVGKNVIAIATCSDGVMDGDETDIDCGGSCVPCKDGLGCKIQGDCLGYNCRAGAYPTCGQFISYCYDGVQNGMETDVDCGGGFCPRCYPGQTCGVNADCTSNNCVAGVCQ